MCVGESGPGRGPASRPQEPGGGGGDTTSEGECGAQRGGEDGDGEKGAAGGERNADEVFDLIFVGRFFRKMKNAISLFVCRHQEAESVRRELEAGDHSPWPQQGSSMATKSPSSSVTGLSAISSGSLGAASQASNSTTPNTSTVATATTVTPPSGAGIEALTVNSSPRPHTPHGEIDFTADGDVEELSKQLEKEKCVCVCVTHHS